MDGLCAEYGWTLEYVMEELPLAMAFAMYIRASHRNAPPDESVYTYEDDQMIEDLVEAERVETDQ